MNGRAETEVGTISRQTKTLLSQAGVSTELWPLAARHAAERRLRIQMEVMKMPVKALLPFGSWGYARVKYWNERSTDWRKARMKVQILVPDASMTGGGTMSGLKLESTCIPQMCGPGRRCLWKMDFRSLVMPKTSGIRCESLGFRGDGLKGRLHLKHFEL